MSNTLYLREVKVHGQYYGKVIALLLFFTIIIFFQNYFKHGFNDFYNPYRSFLFNFTVICMFAFFLPLIVLIKWRLDGYKKIIKLALHGLILMLILISYALISSVIVHLFGFVSQPFYPQYISKYLFNTSLIHCSIYLILAIFWVRSSKPKNRFLLVKDLKNHLKIKVSQIRFIEGMDHYVKIYTTDKFYIKKISLKSVMKTLDSNDFVRIHKSYIVNRKYISSFNLRSSDPKILLSDNHSINIGKTYLKEVANDPFFANV